MKVGVLIEFTSNTDIDAKFAELKEMGVDSCQLVCWDRPTLQDDAMAEAINKGLEKYGIHATAFWCGWEGRKVWDFYEGQLTLGLIPSDYRVERLKMLMEGSDFAKKIHVTDLATHVGFMPENPYDPKYEEVLVACKAIVAKCKEAGVTLTGAGATFPYKKDPKDSNIRIAPSFPTPEEMAMATDLFVLCVKMVSVDKLLESK